MNTESTSAPWTPTKLWEALQIWTVSLAIVKISIFRLSAIFGIAGGDPANPGIYVQIILLSFILGIPFGIFRKKRLQLLAFLCADIIFTCYLLINTGYFTGIAAGLVMVLTTVALKSRYTSPRKLHSVPAKGKMQYCGYLLVWSILACCL